MKKYLFLGLICAATSSFAAPTITDKSSEREQVGYSFGYLMGKSNANALNNLDINSFLEGFKTGYAGQDSTLTNEQMASILNQYKRKMDAEELVTFQQSAAENLKAGSAFLQSNASKTGIKTTASGLQYQVLSQGNGKKPTATSQVEVHYEGRLLDGTVFDSSIARDEPVTLPLNQVIKGWQEGIPLMSEGSKYRFFIPANLAYGEVGAGDAIPPNSTLIFDIQLIKVVS
ncbi:FKBP-type peptidyl-prolyl cis-trans isomerase [Acinetobacter populi]|uniref:Peptidyl-prolyl cis-trans isomerase n=1 Tax=Acinetobacter populi TaxID=1582270 RepID=A0A1Z9YTH7_9GAMM|nr:FKBP-type peptidyl-prolyl cis-trans isomerase [Acinetobacter populi]MCH4248718.1 FKBP-type peptidyl-prolyl cis-trans isomerase [Acinetobacter populi]OUY05524.1 peptidylprolyl isomerase [Acinetobacter populi]